MAISQLFLPPPVWGFSELERVIMKDRFHKRRKNIIWQECFDYLLMQHGRNMDFLHLTRSQVPCIKSNS
jgi:hypothetical protein